MTEETNEAPEEQDVGQEQPEKEGPERIRTFGPFSMSALSGLFGGGRSVHEIGVQGSVLEQTRSLVEDYIRPEIGVAENPDGTQAVIAVSKDGVQVLDPAQFDAWRDSPRFRAGTAKLLSLDSFIAHVNRFRDLDTTIFADNNREKPSLTAVLDYHRAGAEGDPRFGRHRSTFAFPLSDEWLAWTKNDGQVMKMGNFARFLDDHIIDVLPAHVVALGEEEDAYLAALGDRGIIADPARLMDLARGLQINERAVVREAVNLGDGTGALEFQNEHVDAAGNKLVIPGLFVIGIPVFKNDEKYQVLARLRYRSTPEGVVFWYELWRLDRVFDHAFNGAVERVQTETETSVLLGVDEGNCAP